MVRAGTVGWTNGAGAATRGGAGFDTGAAMTGTGAEATTGLGTGMDTGTAAIGIGVRAARGTAAVVVDLAGGVNGTEATATGAE